MNRTDYRCTARKNMPFEIVVVESLDQGSCLTAHRMDIAAAGFDDHMAEALMLPSSTIDTPSVTVVSRVFKPSGDANRPAQLDALLARLLEDKDNQTTVVVMTDDDVDDLPIYESRGFSVRDTWGEGNYPILVYTQSK